MARNPKSRCVFTGAVIGLCVLIVLVLIGLLMPGKPLKDIGSTLRMEMAAPALPFIYALIYALLLFGIEPESIAYNCAEYSFWISPLLWAGFGALIGYAYWIFKKRN